jgi:hypothetical protein
MPAGRFGADFVAEVANDASDGGYFGCGSGSV